MIKEANQFDLPTSPFAKHRGILNLGNKEVDCYVLDTGERVISMSATVKAIANVDSGKISSYIGIKALQPYINSDTIVSQMIEFSIPGNPIKSRGMKAETFLEICSAYVSAMSDSPGQLTPKQLETAVNCAILVAACAKVGLIALIDEATGYQYEREADALQVKLRAFITEELRDWEKTFPDELWEEFGRLTNWQQSLQQRPKYWGKLVLELIYDALDPDIANYLKSNKPKPKHGSNYHQWLTEDVGVKALITHINQIIGIAKTCDTMKELREKVAHYYGKEPLQLTINYYVKSKTDIKSPPNPDPLPTK